MTPLGVLKKSLYPRHSYGFYNNLKTSISIPTAFTSSLRTNIHVARS